jgi:hypothetical protein
MNETPQTQGDDADAEDGRQADAMKAQLKRDVESWSKTRSESSAGRITEPAPPVARKSSLRPIAGAGQATPPAVPAAKEADIRKKPFRMSYDGVTTEEYIQYMLDRGSR